MKTLEELVAPCGIHCGSCPLYLAGDDPKLAAILAEKMNTTPEKVVCGGCRPTNGRPFVIGDSQCATFLCAHQKGISFCCDCADFPCDMLAPSADRANVLPHNTKIYNLLLIKRDGLRAWAETEPGLRERYYKGRMVIGKGPQMPAKKDD